METVSPAVQQINESTKKLVKKKPSLGTQTYQCLLRHCSEREKLNGIVETGVHFSTGFFDPVKQVLGKLARNRKMNNKRAIVIRNRAVVTFPKSKGKLYPFVTSTRKQQGACRLRGRLLNKLVKVTT